MEISLVKCANLLVLRNIYPEDFTHENDERDIKIKQVEPLDAYDEIPGRFTSVEKWPSFSNLKCWECDQLPVSYPRFVPINPEKDENGNDICDVLGNFCEWNCAVRYTTKEIPKEQQWDTLRMICVFESKFSGIYKEKIMPSPPKTLMRAYCGRHGLTPREYKEKIELINDNYGLSSYKMIHFTNKD